MCEARFCVFDVCMTKNLAAAGSVGAAAVVEHKALGTCRGRGDEFSLAGRCWVSAPCLGPLSCQGECKRCSCIHGARPMFGQRWSWFRELPHQASIRAFALMKTCPRNSPPKMTIAGESSRRKHLSACTAPTARAHQRAKATTYPTTMPPGEPTCSGVVHDFHLPA